MGSRHHSRKKQFQPPTVSQVPHKFAVDERVLCYEPDKNKARVLYDSKVLQVVEKTEKKKIIVEYKIHFFGWNSSWDRYVTENCVLKDTAENRRLQKELKAKADILIQNNLKKKKRKKTLSELLKEATKDKEGKAPKPANNRRERREAGNPSFSDSSSSDYDSSDDEEERKIVAHILLTEQVRTILERDYFNILNNNMLARVPADISVIFVFEEYVKFVGFKELKKILDKWQNTFVTGNFPSTATTCSPAVLNQLSLNAKYPATRFTPPLPDPFLEDIAKIYRKIRQAQEIVYGLKTIFDYMLYQMLLYDAENEQYKSYKRMRPKIPVIDCMRMYPRYMLANSAASSTPTAKPNAPTAESSTPSAKPNAPTATLNTPASQSSTPIAELNKLTAEVSKPNADLAEPTAESNKPTAESNKLTAESNKPTAEASKPNADLPESIAESNKLTAESNKLTAESNKLTAESNKLTAESNQPTAESNKPNAELNQPTAESNKPTAGTTEPAAESHKSNADIAEPAAESNKPNADLAEPTAESNKPNADIAEPTAESNKPTAESSKPNADIAEPTAESNKPTAELSKQNADTAEPTAESNKLNAESNNPTAEPTKPTAESNKQNSEPTKPNADSAKPTAESNSPTAEPTKPTAEPTKPTADSVKPTVESNNPTAESKKPTIESNKSTAELIQPTAEFAKPTAKSNLQTAESNKPNKLTVESNKPTAELNKPSKLTVESNKPTPELSKPFMEFSVPKVSTPMQNVASRRVTEAHPPTPSTSTAPHASHAVPRPLPPPPIPSTSRAPQKVQMPTNLRILPPCGRRSPNDPYHLWTIKTEQYVRDLSAWRMLPADCYAQEQPDPSMVYGLVHLLRLFVKLPDILNRTLIPRRKVRIIAHHVNMMVEHIQATYAFPMNRLYVKIPKSTYEEDQIGFGAVPTEADKCPAKSSEKETDLSKYHTRSYRTEILDRAIPQLPKVVEVPLSSTSDAVEEHKLTVTNYCTEDTVDICVETLSTQSTLVPNSDQSNNNSVAEEESITAEGSITGEESVDGEGTISVEGTVSGEGSVTREGSIAGEESVAEEDSDGSGETSSQETMDEKVYPKLELTLPVREVSVTQETKAKPKPKVRREVSPPAAPMARKIRKSAADAVFKTAHIFNAIPMASRVIPVRCDMEASKTNTNLTPRKRTRSGESQTREPKRVTRISESAKEATSSKDEATTDEDTTTAKRSARGRNSRQQQRSFTTPQASKSRSPQGRRGSTTRSTSAGKKEEQPQVEKKRGSTSSSRKDTTQKDANPLDKHQTDKKAEKTSSSSAYPNFPPGDRRPIIKLKKLQIVPNTPPPQRVTKSSSTPKEVASPTKTPQKTGAQPATTLRLRSRSDERQLRSKGQLINAKSLPCASRSSSSSKSKERSPTRRESSGRRNSGTSSGTNAKFGEQSHSLRRSKR
ncbi:unnamed protein product [Orchesella dallaii]|uniref:NuA4 complex subunit EAF3 n=1 Tax=Orchesella dallaii TaxID=48710 RepID=A0ABP1PZQ5_9HEXA